MIWGTASCHNAMKFASVYGSWSQRCGSVMTMCTFIWWLTIKTLPEKGFVYEHAIILHGVDVCICCGDREAAKWCICVRLSLLSDNRPHCHFKLHSQSVSSSVQNILTSCMYFAVQLCLLYLRM